MTRRSTRDEMATVAAREIIDAEKKKRDAKTARLKAARLAKEAAEGDEPDKPKPGGPKAKGKRHGPAG
jgi:hypothetical protein